jgi:hypothetical protein
MVREQANDYSLKVVCMKACILSGLLCCHLLPQLQAQASNYPPRLTGIINSPNRKAAFLKILSGRFQGATWKLGEGQRCVDVEVIRINPAAGSAEIRQGGTNTPITVSLARKGNPGQTADGSLELEDADLDVVLALYAECAGRTLLRWPRLPATSFTLATSDGNPAQAALVLEKVLAEAGIATIPDGAKFLMVVPKPEAAIVKLHASAPKRPPDDANETERIPAGEIYFPNTDLRQAAGIYAAWIGRKLDPTQPLPRRTLAISFRNQTPLTKEECIYALDTLFNWQGVKIVPVGSESARLVAVSDKGE